MKPSAFIHCRTQISTLNAFPSMLYISTVGLHTYIYIYIHILIDIHITIHLYIHHCIRLDIQLYIHLYTSLWSWPILHLSASRLQPQLNLLTHPPQPTKLLKQLAMARPAALPQPPNHRPNVRAVDLQSHQSPLPCPPNAHPPWPMQHHRHHGDQNPPVLTPAPRLPPGAYRLRHPTGKTPAESAVLDPPANLQHPLLGRLAACMPA